MNEALIEKWNSRIKRGDTVYHLGDFCFGKKPEDFTRHFCRLNGNIHYVQGNHDGLTSQFKNCFESYHEGYLEVKIDGKHVVFSHYPILSWNRKNHGSFMLHGHCHYTLVPSRKDNAILGKILDVGVDGNDLYPYNWDEIIEIMKNKPVESSVDWLKKAI